MTITLDLLLLVVAVICFVVAAFSAFTGSPRVSALGFVAVGLLSWVITAITP